MASYRNGTLQQKAENNLHYIWISEPAPFLIPARNETMSSKAMRSLSRISPLPNFQIYMFSAYIQLHGPLNVICPQRYLREIRIRRVIPKDCVRGLSPCAKAVGVVRAFEQRVIGWRLALESTADCWCLWRGAIRFMEGERIVEQGAEGRKGY